MMARSGEDARNDGELGGPDVCRVHARKQSVTRLGLVEQQAASLRHAQDETVAALQRLEQRRRGPTLFRALLFQTVVSEPDLQRRAR